MLMPNIKIILLVYVYIRTLIFDPFTGVRIDIKFDYIIISCCG